ncbi:hypothetical protein [Geminocystis sp. NIES-3709]|uniref:hypothetical protein n=1 Tax=Geminocystis sp. NIES-3709 TaxID=1617448 RepID=UPI000826DFAC|nr:hypothetical protein [Geminocystis sp. NIES-3709]
MIDYSKIQKDSFLKFKTNDGNDNDLYIVISNNPFKQELTVKWYYPMQNQQNLKTLKYQELDQYDIEVFSPNVIISCPDCHGTGTVINGYSTMGGANPTHQNCKRCYTNGYIVK